MTLALHIAAIHNEYGLYLSELFQTREQALKHVYEYVKEWWDDVSDLVDIPEVPVDMERAVELYFNHHPDGEAFTIERKVVVFSFNQIQEWHVHQ